MPLLDPVLAVAFALCNTKGAYAFLLGSGVSRGAGIPTGWEMMQDLVRRVAALSGAGDISDPVEWYTDRFKQEPKYDVLLAELARTPAERRQLLRSYFEPTRDDLAAGRKVPSAAHRGIASLVASGHVRVILTTNFDQLLEQALRDAGVTPAVIATPDAVNGALPLPHQEALVIKLHGDYLDTRIRNTADELAEYEPELSGLLDRVLDEFGLVICGWSGEWDTALRQAFERCPNHRFTTFWTTRSPVKSLTERLVNLRRAQVVHIDGADSFFSSLRDSVDSIEEAGRSHPMTSHAAVATLKRYLPHVEDRIRLHDLVSDATERLVVDVIAGPPGGELPQLEQELSRRLRFYEARSESVMALMAHGAFWGERYHDALWANVIERLFNGSAQPPNSARWYRLRWYPAQLALYAAGVAAAHQLMFDRLKVLVGQPRLRRLDGTLGPPAELLHAQAVVDTDDARRIPDVGNRRTPFSEYLLRATRHASQDLIPDDVDYELAFDRFEYFVGLACAGYRHATDPESGVWGPVGRFSWRGKTQLLAREIEDRVRIDGPSVVGDGLFEGSFDRFVQVRHSYHQVCMLVGSSGLR